MDENLNFPDWTEIGQEGGLDPLAMQRPIEIIYQALVPGISTITLRLRYYSFFCWMLEAYARTIGNTDPAVFRSFQRRCEILYALIAARGPSERGVTGIEWAEHHLSSGDDVIDFRGGADTDAIEDRYIKNKAGAFGAIYSTQMRDMDLLIFGEDNNPVPICTERGVRLAAAYDKMLGPTLRMELLQTVDRGNVSVAALDSLARMSPSNIEPGGDEHCLLRELLVISSSSDSGNDLRRKQTLRKLLRLSLTSGARPRTDAVKWTWFMDRAVDTEADDQVSDLWVLYQANDLLRLAYEYLLAAGLRLLSHSPARQLRLHSLVTELTELAGFSAEIVWAEYGEDCLRQLGLNQTQDVYRQMTSAMSKGDLPMVATSAFQLIALLQHTCREFSSVIEARLPFSQHFQSLRTELDFLNKRMAEPTISVATTIVRDRIIKRHLWIAARKFRNQKAYTYLMEPADGVVRFRQDFAPAPSSPRLDQALNFLTDLKMLGKDGITPVGRQTLAAR